MSAAGKPLVDPFLHQSGQVKFHVTAPGAGKRLVFNRSELEALHSEITKCLEANRARTT